MDLGSIILIIHFGWMVFAADQMEQKQETDEKLRSVTVERQACFYDARRLAEQVRICERARFIK